jgi:hypothetical protein
LQSATSFFFLVKELCKEVATIEAATIGASANQWGRQCLFLKSWRERAVNSMLTGRTRGRVPWSGICVAWKV